MDIYGAEAFGAAIRPLEVDVYTDAYRISGQLQTRFSRVADMLNQLSSTHLTLERATLSEFADPAGTLSAPQAIVSLDEIVLLIAAAAEGTAQSEMRIAKRPVRAQVALPPFRLVGTVHIAPGSRPADGLLNMSERYMPMTDVTITSGPYPELGRSAAAVALRRDRAHVVLVTDDEQPEELLADVLDERTAEAWLRTPADEQR